jgi:hypothetical protein
MAQAPDPTAISRSRIPYAEEYYDQLAYEFDALGVYRLRPNQRLPHVTINPHGYRGAALTKEETILLLGDSVTFGVGASSDEAIFARYVERALGQRVADASVRGYRVFQHYAQLPRLLELLPQVRQVLVWFGYADLLYWVTTGGCVEGTFQFEWKYRTVQPRWRRWLSPLVTSRQALVRATGTLDELVVHVSAYVRGLLDVCAARRIAVALLVQPFVRSRPVHEPLRELADLYDDKTLEKCGQRWYAIAPRFIQQVRAGLDLSEGSLWCDCQELVTEEDFLDQVHLQEASVGRLAKQIAERWLEPHAATVQGAR